MKSTDKKLRDRVRDAIRLKHYSIRTEQAYVNWIKRYIYFHNVRHPAEMGAAEVQAREALLTWPWRKTLPLCGSGLRLMECMRLRVKDLDFAQRIVLVRDGKGEAVARDRCGWLERVLPEKL
jgi:hypothetical protein